MPHRRNKKKNVNPLFFWPLLQTHTSSSIVLVGTEIRTRAHLILSVITVEILMQCCCCCCLFFASIFSIFRFRRRILCGVHIPRNFCSNLEHTHDVFVGCNNSLFYSSSIFVCTITLRNSQKNFNFNFHWSASRLFFFYFSFFLLFQLARFKTALFSGFFIAKLTS